MYNCIKSFISNVSGIGYDFFQYIKRNRMVILLLAIFTYLVHGSKLHSLHLGIDTENILAFPDKLYTGWHSIGRYGLTFLKSLTGQMIFNPFFAAGLTLVLLVLAAVAFGFVFDHVFSGSAKESLALFVFGAVVIASPIMSEQLYFSLQSAEVALSLVLCAASLLFAHEWCQKPGIFYYICSVIFLPVIFSVYQSFVPLYIFGVVALCCLYLPFSDQIRHIQDYLRYIGLHMVIFLSGFFLNQRITAVYYDQSSYLTNQIQWDPNDLAAGLRRIYAHIFVAALGKGTFYSASFAAIALLLLVLWLVKLFRGKTVGRGIFNLFLLGSLYLSPFYLTIVLGERPVARAELVLPFTTGFMLYLCCVLLYRQPDWNSALWKTLAKVVFCILCLVCIWDEADTSSRMYYTDNLRFQQDASLAEDLICQIALATGDPDYTGPVVFVGKKEPTYNASYVKGDVMGQSFFAWDTDVAPQNHWSSIRIVGFMNCMGANYTPPTEEQTASATAVAASLPCYPQEGSVLMQWDFVVVKLSE